MRAISTVLDVTLCLLLVSASAFVIVGAEPPQSTVRTRTAESTANTLATSTGGVDYTISSDSGTLHRTAHGTLAGLLGEAALANTTIRGVELSRTSGPFEHAVKRRVQERFDRPARVRIVVQWKPYRGAHLGGRFAVGSSPPTRADVHAAVVSVPSGLPPARKRAIDAARQNGYHAVARIVASGIVAGFVPKRTTTLALHDRETGKTVAIRLRRLLRLYDVDGSTSNRLDSERTRRALIEAVANTVESDLRKTFATPDSAARSVSVGRVRIFVRTWSP